MRELKPRLSVIIPAYNAAQTIRRCLDSILSLPLDENELEIIAVDDCSTDDTLDVLNQYSCSFHNVIVVRQKYNQRQGAARNRGIDLCSGDYVLFVDADDVIVTKGIHCALVASQKLNTDICYFDFEFQTEDGSWHLLNVFDKVRNSTMDSKQYLEEYYTTFFNGPWRSLYKSELLKRTGIRFVEGVQWEDCDWTVKMLSRAKMVQFVDGVGYRYCYNVNSTIHQRSIKALVDRVSAGKRLLVFGTEIQDDLPQLSEKIIWEGKNRYVIDVLRLRNLTKYKIKDLYKLYEMLGKECRETLLRFQWPFWERFFLRFRLSSIAILSIACPVASIGRIMVQNLRRK